MSSFQQLPKSMKKAIRYILQDVHSLTREAGVDGKNDSLLYSKTKEGIKKE